MTPPSFAGTEGKAEGAIPTRELVVACSRAWIDRSGTQVFAWDPIGATPRWVQVVHFDVTPAREFQRLTLNLAIGEIALVSACGHWTVFEGRRHWNLGPEGAATGLDFPLARGSSAHGALMMDVHWKGHSDRLAFADSLAPVTIHGPCTSVSFISNDYLLDDENPALTCRGALHVKIEFPDHAPETNDKEK